MRLPIRNAITTIDPATSVLRKNGPPPVQVIRQFVSSRKMSRPAWSFVKSDTGGVVPVNVTKRLFDILRRPGKMAPS